MLWCDLCFFQDDGKDAVLIIGIIESILAFFLIRGSIFLVKNKDQIKNSTSRLLIAGNSVLFAGLLSFCILSIAATNYQYNGAFSITTSLFDNKKVMIIIPHQDDDINLMCGLIEQYTENNSEVSVIFTTNGDYYDKSEIRAAEALSVLTSLGVQGDNIYYLGFGDQWTPQVFGEKTVQHIYNSVDPDVIWESYYGATSTYGTESINCYSDLPYTRNNFLHSIQSIIQEKNA